MTISKLLENGEVVTQERIEEHLAQVDCWFIKAAYDSFLTTGESKPCYACNAIFSRDDNGNVIFKGNCGAWPRK